MQTPEEPEAATRRETTADSRAFWHERYSRGTAWSGHVNPALEEVAAKLPAGVALDLGCGEGGDVLWLAERGWHATGVDGAAPALERAQREAIGRGIEARTHFLQADLSTWVPDRRWDLVTCHYLHEAPELRAAAFAAARAAVAPGGTLLVVGHHPDESPELQGPPRHERFHADELAGSDSWEGSWAVRTATRPRTSIRGGVTVERLDTVLVATRSATQ